MYPFLPPCPRSPKRSHLVLAAGRVGSSPCFPDSLDTVVLSRSLLSFCFFLKFRRTTDDQTEDGKVPRVPSAGVEGEERGPVAVPEGNSVGSTGGDGGHASKPSLESKTLSFMSDVLEVGSPVVRNAGLLLGREEPSDDDEELPFLELVKRQLTCNMPEPIKLGRSVSAFDRTQVTGRRLLEAKGPEH